MTFEINIQGTKGETDDGGTTPLRSLNTSIVQDTRVDERGIAGGFLIFHQVFESYFGGYDPTHRSQPLS